MIGRAPMMSQPVYPQTFAGQPYSPGQEYAGQSAAWPQAAPAWPQQAPSAPKWTQPPQPIFRGKGADEPVAPPPVTGNPSPESAAVAMNMPSPTQFGIEAKATSRLTDWTAARQRLNQLGAVSFNLDQAPQGGYRFSCFLPTGQAGRTHRVEVTAASEADAVGLALDSAEAWAGGK
jgi:hypothetical protein